MVVFQQWVMIGGGGWCSLIWRSLTLLKTGELWLLFKKISHETTMCISVNNHSQVPLSSFLLILIICSKFIPATRLRWHLDLIYVFQYRFNRVLHRSTNSVILYITGMIFRTCWTMTKQQKGQRNVTECQSRIRDTQVQILTLSWKLSRSPWTIHTLPGQ